MNKNHMTRLKNPNDTSFGQCYAPIENGKPNINKKKHIKEGEDPPKNWIEVDCSFECQSK